MFRIALITLVTVAFTGAVVRTQAGNIHVTEILYQADPNNLGGEFIEIHNRGQAPVDIGSWILTDAIEFTFPPGTIIQPDEYLVVARNQSDAESFYGIAMFGQYQGALSNGGDRIVLQDASLPRRVEDVVTYDDECPWPADADGGGMSLELLEVSLENDEATHWGLGQPFSPGTGNETRAQSDIGELVITEIMYKPKREEIREDNRGPYFDDGDDEFGEYIELLNVTDAAVNLGDWEFTDGIAFRFPEGAIVEPGARILVASDPNMMLERHDLDPDLVFGPFDETGLDDAGERLTLRNAEGFVVDTVKYDDSSPWPLTPDANGSSLEVLAPLSDNSSAANWRTSQSKFPIPGITFFPPDADPDGWHQVVATGEASSNRLYFFLSEPGEWLIDNVQLISRSSGAGLIVNGSFDTDDSGWDKAGNHETSEWTATDGRDGGGAERVIATGPGSNLRNCFMIRRVQEVASGEIYELSMWYKHVSGSRSATLRFAGGGLETHLLASGNDARLRNDFSDVVNPVGFWTLADSRNRVLTGRTGNWMAPVLGPGQPAWTPALQEGEVGDDLTPGWCRSTGGAPSGDFPQGAVGTIGPSRLIWTAPRVGELTLSGGLSLMHREEGGDQRWTLRVNSEVVSEGRLFWFEDEFDSSNPKPLSSGTGGAEALRQIVETGDRVILTVEPMTGSTARLVVFDVASAFRPGVAPLPPILGTLGAGTPGQSNSVSSDGLPPLVRWLRHTIDRPRSSDAVPILARIVSNAPVEAVELSYRVNLENSVTLLEMFDDGLQGDDAPADGIYAVTIPAQSSRSMVHYWVRVRDADGRESVFPFEDDPSPTQAYYHYDDDVTSSLSVFDLQMSSVEFSRLIGQPLVYRKASLAIDGVAFPNVDVRFRGQGSLTRPKKQWKFRFRRHQKYDGNRHIETMANIPFVQKVIFDIFDHGETLNLESDLIRVHMNGDFYGLYIAFEVPNSSWLDKHGYHPDGEVYKARTISTEIGSTLYERELNTDFEYWWSWNKKIRGLERPTEIRELVETLNRLPPDELRSWMEDRIDLDHWFRRWALYIHMNVDDFAAHNYYLFLPGDPGAKWLQLAYDFDSGFTYNRVGPLRTLYGDGLNGDLDLWQNGRFYNIVSTDPVLRTIYRYTLADTNEFYNSGFFFPLIDDMFRTVSFDRQLDGQRWGSSFVRGSTSEIKSVFSGQRSRVQTELEAANLPEHASAICLPPGGTFDGQVLVHMGAPERWTVVYTTDGRDPRLADTREEYNGPVWIDRTQTVRAAAFQGLESGGRWSRVRDYDFFVHPLPEVGPFSRGDCDTNGSMEVSDALHMLRGMFSPEGETFGCRSACDCNADGRLDVSDPFHILAFLLAGTLPPPVAPFPTCDVSTRPSDVDLGCDHISSHGPDLERN